MATPVNDPLFPTQWYIENTGQSGGTAGIDLNVLQVWPDYTGRGVTVGVYDQGVEKNHPDLIANVNPSLFMSAQPFGDGQPTTDSESHGNNVAGVIAATHDNGIGLAGVAYGATLGSVYLDLSVHNQYPDDLKAAYDFAAQNLDISSNSWGISNNFTNFNDADNRGAAQGIDNAIANGRDGLGVVIAFAAGNNRLEGDNTNLSNFANDPAIITVAGIAHTGATASYSTPGASILVAAPTQNIIYRNVDTDGDGVPDSQEKGEPVPETRALVEVARVGNITTTALMGRGVTESGAPGGDYDMEFGGTSAATPMVSSVAALMLEANPKLGYRDVADILALSARNTDTSAQWTINGASNWNGGGMHVNNDVGYGLVDALAAVRLAETWTSQHTAANLVSASATNTVNQNLPDGGQAVVTRFQVSKALNVEDVQVTLDMEHPNVSNLSFLLTSPSGTVTSLLDTPLPLAFPSNPFSMSSTHSLGEKSTGTWTLSIQDKSADGASGRIDSVGLTLLGSTGTLPYVYTNEYAYYAAQNPARTVLNDSSGATVLNASPVTNASTVNLLPGMPSSIGGTPLTIGANTNVVQVYTGDGGDVLVGNGNGALLSSGRGNDLIVPVTGSATLSGGPGLDTAAFPADQTDYSFLNLGGKNVVSGLEGSSTIQGVELLAFRGSIVPTAGLTFLPAESDPNRTALAQV
ncbi:Calcium-dependent protease [Fundidesulfovibrio magnetotacticus]|uniref:Calcium-dependent protease n=1 Tax=Fundidesulfovibrio magnetotacticus TaxID=2730080 RepID=A0A6V8LR82_9BACT|nr:S8 family serine peptidase [Fundidesulfovibrio magnetotacticus]GFK93490.1 Calcium-dependent protease [Fundidesulfovibrio magnetotacticus]